MIAQELALRSLDLPRDAEKLAAMWNASDDQWPGTWTEGVPMTAQRVIDWHSRLNPVDVLIWDAGDAIAGYCSLWQLPKEENVTYIALLNVSPHFQKRSLARKFLTTYVERVVKFGSVRLDLHTWSGNLKAMPLYKKCGFFWQPDTSVHMLNFMPAILAMPLAQPFFDQHDWYESFQRDLAQVEDEETWEGMKVFTYRFSAAGENLTAWADREARAITAIETDKVFAAAIAENIAPPRGLATTLRWKLANKGDQPMTVSIFAGGNDSLKINHRETLTLAPGEQTEITANVDVAATAPDVQEDQAVPSVRSVLVIDGQVLELGTGFRPRAAVEVTTAPEFVTLTPGVEQTVLLQLRSRLQNEVAARVSITPSAGLVCDVPHQTVTLPADGYAAIPVKLRANSAGTYELAVSASFERDGREVRPPAATLGVFALAPGSVLGATVDGKLRLENSFYRLVVSPQGGGGHLLNAASGEHLAWLGGYATPPERPSEYRHGKFDLSIERQDGELVAVAAMASDENPGFVLRKRYSVNAGPLLSLSYDFDNLGAESRSFKGYFGLHEPRGQEATLTLPLQQATVQEPFATFPGPYDDDFRKATTYAEPWGAFESGASTLGAIWGAQMDEVMWSSWWEVTFNSKDYECAPQSRVRTEPLRLYVGPGGWRAVREAWQRLTGQQITLDSAPAAPVAPLLARLDPLGVAANDSANSTLRVEHYVSRKLDGTARLILPDGWQADKTEFALSEINWKKPLVAEVQLKTSAAPGVAVGRIELDTTAREQSFEVPLLRLGDGQPVTVTETEDNENTLLTIANGLLEIDVAPAFGGSVTAIRADGINHLATPYPTVGAIGWMSPWYGGLSPVIQLPGEDNFPGKLWQEHFSGAKIAVRDARGIEWTGVRQQATLQHPELGGMVAEIDTLTVGGSHVVKQVLRMINNVAIERRMSVGFAAYVQPDGSHSNSTLYSALGQMKHAEWNPLINVGNWGIVANPATGRAMALVSPRPMVHLVGWGAEGGHFALLPKLIVPPNGSVEIVGYMVLAPNVAAAQLHAALKDLK